MLEKIGLPAKPSMRGTSWVVDASHCQTCASQFTFINRKHHCRRCGGIFCGNCTSQRMVLRGQGDSAVRICDPCKKLEEAARFELRHGRGSSRTANKGNPKAGPSEEDELLAQLLGTHKQPSEVPARLLGTSSSSASSSKDPSRNEENEIIRSLSANIPQSVPNDVTPDELRQKAVEEKKMHRLLKSQGKADQALQAFKRGRELERQADALEILLRKSRKTAAGKASNAERVSKKQENKKDDLASELKDLGWTDDDIQRDVNPKSLTVEGELSQLLGEVAKKSSPEGKKKGIDNSQVIAMKKRALLLKREGKLTEAKEELKKAKILEKELEERAILGESDESDDELAELVRGLDGHGKTNNNSDFNFDLNAPVELPPMGFDIEKLLSGDVDHFGDFDVTNEDLHDPDMNSVLKSFGWDDEVEVGNSADKNHLSEESVKDQVYTLKKEAVVQKKAGNLSEAMALLKKAKLLEKDLLEVGSKESSPEVKERRISQPSTAANLNSSGGRSVSKNKLAIQRELLTVKKRALALRREGRIEESDRELERGKLLEAELEEADNSKPKPPVEINPLAGNINININLNPLETGEEIGDTEVTESDMRDPNLLSVLQNLGWDEREISLTAAAETDVPVKQQAPKKNKLQLQRELLAVKKRALALRREGKTEEAQRELDSAKVIERELEDLNTAASELKGRQPTTEIPFENPVKLLEDPEETQVTETDMQDPSLMSDLKNIGWDQDDSADAAPSPLLAEKAIQKQIENVLNKPAAAIQSGFGDMDAGSKSNVKNEGAAAAEPFDSVPEKKARKSKGEIQRELLALKRKALQLRRQGREEEAELELEKAKELEQQITDLESFTVPVSEQLLMPDVEIASSSTRVTEKPIQVTQVEEKATPFDQVNKDSQPSDQNSLKDEILMHKRKALALKREGRINEAEERNYAEKASPFDQVNKDPRPLDQNSIRDEILMHKRKALALKREGRINEAKEELRQAKLLEKSVEEESNQSTDSPAAIMQQQEAIPDPPKRVQTRKPIPTRDRVKIQQESLSHKRNALKLRREGKIAEADAEFEIAKSLEAQLDDSTGEDTSSSSDVAVDDFLDPQLMSALRSIGWGDSDIGSLKQEPQKQVMVEKQTKPAVQRDDERSKMEGEIKREKIKALNLKRAGREKEALEVLRNAKMMEKKLASMN